MACGPDGLRCVRWCGQLGRNQQLRLDVAVKNDTELRLSLSDPRLGARFGWSTRVFKRAGNAFDLATGGRASSSPSDGDDGGDAATGAPLVVFGTPTAGVDVTMSGRGWHGATVGFGVSAEAVPTAPSATAVAAAAAAAVPHGASWFSRLMGAPPPTAAEAPPAIDTPVLVHANLQRAWYRGGVGSGGRRPMKLASKVALSRTLPFVLPSCPDYWRFKCDGTFAMPLLRRRDATATALAAPPSATPTATPTAAPTAAAQASPTTVSAEVKPMEGDAGEFSLSGVLLGASRVLRGSSLSLRTRATIATERMPAYEAAALGGDGSIRGYDADELGRAHSSLAATAELLLPLSGAGSGAGGAAAAGPPVGLSLFGDAGGGTVRQPDTGEMALSSGAAAGVGLRYGPFRIDWAFNYRGRKKVHVGLVQD